MYADVTRRRLRRRADRRPRRRPPSASSACSPSTSPTPTRPMRENSHPVARDVDARGVRRARSAPPSRSRTPTGSSRCRTRSRDAVAEGSAATDDVDGAAHRLAAIVDGLVVAARARHGRPAPRATALVRDALADRAQALLPSPHTGSLSDRLRTDLRPFLEPATAVVLGASPRSGVAGQWVRNLTAGRVPRDRHPPRRTASWAAVPVVPAIADLDHVPDIACVALGAGNAVAGVEAGARRTARGTSWCPASGPETGPERRRRARPPGRAVRRSTTRRWSARTAWA